MDQEEKEDLRNGRVAAIVHLSVLGWSATILTAGYLNIIKADPTFVASIFTGCLSAYGIQRADNSRKPDRPGEQPIKSSSPSSEMKRWLLLIALAAPTAVSAQSAYPNFTTGSMTSTTVTDTTVNETINIERYGGSSTSWTGTNITPSGPVGDASTTYSVTNAGADFSLEIYERPAGVIEIEDITRTTTQTSTTNSLSVFSQ